MLAPGIVNNGGGIVAACVRNCRISSLSYVRNPQRLTRIASETPLTLR